MEKNSSPKVIACVPAYNSEKFIESTLQCLKKQNYKNFRVLISDDCSTDDTVSVIRSFTGNDDRFMLFEQQENLGWVDNVNFLVEKALTQGKYMFILPHDDHIAFDYIQKLTQALEENPPAILSFCDMECISAGGRDIRTCPGLDKIEEKKIRLNRLLQREKWWWIAYRGITRTAAVKSIIPLRKNIFGMKEYSMDWIWLIKLSLQGSFVRVPEVLYSKHFLENNLSYKLKFTNRNYFGNLFTCSIELWRSPLKISEQLAFQRMIFILVLKHMIIASGLYTFGRRLKALLTV